MATDATPFQTPPSMKNAAGLSGSNEYAATWTGQSNSRPRGYPADGLSVAQELALGPTGKNVVGIIIPDSSSATLAVTFTNGTDKVTWTAHPFEDGDIVAFTNSGGALPAELVAKRTYVVRNQAVNDFELSQTATGPIIDFTDNGTGTHTGLQITREVGSEEYLACTTPLGVNEWSTNSRLRLGVMVALLPGAPEPGYAQVLSNSATSITVKWLSRPDNDVTVSGYLVRDPYPGFNGRPGGARYYAYEQVRVLTPYMPTVDIQLPQPSEPPTPLWLTPHSAEYPAVDGPQRTGKRLLLPAPWTLPAAVTKFEDLAVFLPLTRREGSHGYGISDVADGTFQGTGAPVAHPLLTYDLADAFTFANEVSDPALAPTLAATDLTGGYLIVDWSAAVSGATLRSWARIAENTGTTFDTDAASWLGDGKPTRTPSTEDTTGSLAFANDGGGRLEATWTGHGFNNGDRVAFTVTGAGVLPTGLVAGRPYVVREKTTNTFQMSETLNHVRVPFTDVGTNPITATEVWWYTAWIGHWYDNPYMWLPGPEFGMPNGDQQPQGPLVHWRARGQLLFNHMNVFSEAPATGNLLYSFHPMDGISDGRFGAMLPFAWRLAASLGKRVNLVCLGVNGAPLVPTHLQNKNTYPGRVGWWEHDRYGFGLSLENTESLLAARLKNLITVMAPAALVAEANTKPLKYLASVHVQGEGDALLDAGREIYGATITDYKRWLRDLFDTISANPYEGGALVPFAQPLLTRDPWESAATSGVPDFQTFGFDTQGDTNDNIRRAHTADPFANYSLTEDIPKLIFDKVVAGIDATNVVDNAHFSGQGMVWQGARLAQAILDLIEYAFSHSSTALTTTNARLLRVANLSLLYIGQGARQITTLAGTSAEATLIRTLLPEAIRQMLAMRSWTWATRLETATLVKHDNPRWKSAYAVPGRAITVLEIIPPKATTVTGTVASPYPVPIDTDFPPAVAKPEPFEIMRDQSGARILFTDVEEIAGDVTESEVADGVLHPERLPTSPLIRYVDHALDPSDFSDAFVTALSWYLASMLAPSLIKGSEGDRVAAQALSKCGAFVRVEAISETRTQNPRVDHREEHRAPWISER